MALIVPYSNFENNENQDDSFGCMNMSSDELKKASELVDNLLKELKKENEKGKKMEKFSPTGIIENVFDDNIAFVEYYEQFCYANQNQNTRIEAVTNVASVCYANPKAFGSESLYNRLACESKGLPSSSFEMIPMLFTAKEITELYFGRLLYIYENNAVTKFGEWIEDGKYLLTNFRAVTYLFENLKIDLRNRFNTIAECEIIKKHYAVFRMKIDLPTRSQFVRHRVNLQELSRRYVSGSKVPFEFYISEKMNKVNGYYDFYDSDANLISLPMETRDVINICLNHYNKALEDGIKPEEARRIIPQAAYSELWAGFQPAQLENFMKLRLDSHSQREIRLLAEAMKKLLGE